MCFRVLDDWADLSGIKFLSKNFRQAAPGVQALNLVWGPMSHSESMASKCLSNSEKLQNHLKTCVITDSWSPPGNLLGRLGAGTRMDFTEAPWSFRCRWSQTHRPSTCFMN